MRPFSEATPSGYPHVTLSTAQCHLTACADRPPGRLASGNAQNGPLAVNAGLRVVALASNRAGSVACSPQWTIGRLVNQGRRSAAPTHRFHPQGTDGPAFQGRGAAKEVASLRIGKGYTLRH